MTVKRDAARMANVPWPPHDFSAAVERLLVLDDDDWVVYGYITELFVTRVRKDTITWWGVGDSYSWVRGLNHQLVAHYQKPEVGETWLRMDEWLPVCTCTPPCKEQRVSIPGLNGVYGNHSGFHIPHKWETLAESDAKRFTRAR